MSLHVKYPPLNEFPGPSGPYLLKKKEQKYSPRNKSRLHGEQKYNQGNKSCPQKGTIFYSLQNKS
jgi:hypothetical protein